MTVLQFNGARTRDAYPELRRQHVEYCLRDLFALCVAAADGCHAALAETLTAIHGMHRALCPRISVNFNQLIMALEAGDGNDAEAMVRRSRNSPRVDGALDSDRDLVKRYILGDTRPAIDAMMEGFSHPDDLAWIRNMVEAKYIAGLQSALADKLAQQYSAPSGNDLHAAVNEALSAAGLEPYADKAAPKPPRTARPAFSLVPPSI